MDPYSPLQTHFNFPPVAYAAVSSSDDRPTYLFKTSMVDSVEPEGELSSRIVTLLNQRKNDEAVKELTDTLNYIPKSSVARVFRASLFFLQKKSYPAAAADLDQAAGSYPSSPFPPNTFHDLMKTPHFPLEWISGLDFIIEQESKHFPALFLRGLMYQSKSDWEIGALEMGIIDLEKALVLHPDFSLAWRYLGYGYLKLSKGDEALESFKKGLEIEPGNDKLWTGLGVAHSLTGRPDLAIACFEEAITLNPYNHIARHSLQKLVDLYSPKTPPLNT